jgi:hypothetical protein
LHLGRDEYLDDGLGAVTGQPSKALSSTLGPAVGPRDRHLGRDQRGHGRDRPGLGGRAFKSGQNAICVRMATPSNFALPAGESNAVAARDRFVAWCHALGDRAAQCLQRALRKGLTSVKK